MGDASCPSPASNNVTRGDLDRDGAVYFPSLERLHKVENLDILEAGLHIGTGLLHRLRTLLRDASKGDREAAPSWLISQVDELEKAQPARTLTAVCGATGAGKSSLINAVLDEER